MFTFMIGPLNVLLELNEGKLTLQKMQEDYEDERIDFMQYAQDAKERRNNDILPTSASGPRKRSSAQTAPRDSSEFN